MTSVGFRVLLSAVESAHFQQGRGIQPFYSLFDVADLMRSRISFRRTFLGLSMGAIARGEEGVLSSAFRIANAFIMLCFLQLNEITLVSSIALSRAFHN